MGYDALPANELKQRARWDVYLLMLRALARSSAIRRGCTNTIRTILRRAGADADGGCGVAANERGTRLLHF
ncbi:MAG: hypothetical protein DME87_05875 [Verrucomicrobia bacterium]|nr:MAG: hypothetical protein DME87_05875 [Verrucomicrobiota bacterium]